MATQAEINEGQATQAEINQGQKKVNGNLCRVDWRIIEALREVSVMLGQTGANAAAIAHLKATIEAADQISDKVAGDDPPGCFPRNRMT